MKKLISLMLVIFMMTLLFVGCVRDSSNDDDDNAKSSETTLAQNNGGSNGESNKKAELSRGKITGDVYKNDYMGFQFTKPESWVYSTDEEIASALNLGADFMGEKFKQALENNPSIYDMMVVDTITRTNINVGYENLSKTFSSNITEKQYAEALKQQLSSVSSMTVIFPDKF